MSYRLRVLKKRLITRPRQFLRGWFRGFRDLLRPSDYGTLQKRVMRLESNMLNLVVARSPDVAGPMDQRTTLRRSELRIYSENGEDGILLHLFSKLGVTNRRFVEFGIGDITKCNTTLLALGFGWTGLLMDGNRRFIDDARRFYEARTHLDPTRVQLAECWVTPDNINAILAEHDLEGEIDLLSVDIDGNDYWVWKAIDSIDPRVVIVEYNASLGIEEELITKYHPSFNRYDNHPLGWYHSASLPAIERLGSEKGYVLVGCDSSGLNAFFVRRDVAEGKLAPLSAKEAYYPEIRRLRIASSEEQYRSLRALPFEHP